jgi:hypothetical protein
VNEINTIWTIREQIQRRDTDRSSVLVRKGKSVVTYEQKYLDELRLLTLKAVSGFDCTIHLFGSYMRGTNRRSSDIDIGFSNLDER